MNIEDQVKRVQNKVIDAQKELEELIEIEKQFPDVKLIKNHEYSSALVNPFVDSVEFGRSCGCCDDATRYARPYLIKDNIKIHSKPHEFDIGSSSYCYDPSFIDEMKKASISKTVIIEVLQHFREEQIEYIKGAQEELDSYQKLLDKTINDMEGLQ